MRYDVGIFAHNEEKRITACLTSLPLDNDDFRFHVLANGCTDKTEDLARSIAQDRANIHVHTLPARGKAATWNSFVYEIAEPVEAIIALDGDAVIAPGSLPNLVAALKAHPQAHIASALPLNGRRASVYQTQMRERGDVFGDLYAMSGAFIALLKRKNIRIPQGLVGDDGFLGAMAHTDARTDAHWRRDGVVVCEDAGFYAEVFHPLRINDYQSQARRMVNYSLRYYQNRIITDYMQEGGAQTLPSTVEELYANGQQHLKLRYRGYHTVFDYTALQRIKSVMHT